MPDIPNTTRAQTLFLPAVQTFPTGPDLGQLDGRARPQHLRRARLRIGHEQFPATVVTFSGLPTSGWLVPRLRFGRG